MTNLPKSVYKTKCDISNYYSVERYAYITEIYVSRAQMYILAENKPFYSQHFYVCCVSTGLEALKTNKSMFTLKKKMEFRITARMSAWCFWHQRYPYEDT